MKDSFIEITVQNHIILHGFDEQNKEIIEGVKVDKPSKKLVAVNRILSVSDKYILTNYAFNRLVYWEYHEPYEGIRKRISEAW